MALFKCWNKVKVRNVKMVSRLIGNDGLVGCIGGCDERVCHMISDEIQSKQTGGPFRVDQMD